ncbi:MAG: hypothetical protein E6J40_01410 [Chloroflexi bacterium]|nr:MAG: hypothetical protein E6J40_01410 [Chloroflexota bacterium]
MALALLGIALILVAVLTSSMAPRWLTMRLVIDGFLLLAALYLLGYLLEALVLLGIRIKR